MKKFTFLNNTTMYLYLYILTISSFVLSITKPNEIRISATANQSCHIFN